MVVRDWENPDTMLTVDTVLERIVSTIQTLTRQNVPISDALGLVLAEDIVAPSDVPPFRNSAMDGYALRSAETSGQGPKSFVVSTTIAAGDGTALSTVPGTAARIMTGAPMPEGADAVIRFEEVFSDEPNTIIIRRKVDAGENVRLPGEDVEAGAVVLRKGQVIGGLETGMLAALNQARVPVYRRPIVGILSTGDEVVDVGPELLPGQIRDANSYALAAMIAEIGARSKRLGVAGDSRAELRERVHAAAGCDLLVTSGGVSHGDFDLVKDLLREDGKIDILTVRMKPGKPLAFGSIGQLPLIGLPGNPAAAIVSFHQFVRPAILALMGRRDFRLPTVRARLLERIENRGRRRHFERGVLFPAEKEWHVRPTGIYGSAMLSSLVAANCYIVIPEDVEVADVGSDTDVQILDNSVFNQASAI